MSKDGLSVSHQLCFNAIADANSRHLRLLEIAVDPVAVGVDDGDVRDPLARIVADPHQKVGDVAIDRTEDLGPPQIELGLCDLLLRGVEGGLCLNRGAGKSSSAAVLDRPCFRIDGQLSRSAM